MPFVAVAEQDGNIIYHPEGQDWMAASGESVYDTYADFAFAFKAKATCERR